jgi:hypothetical protein
MRDRRPSRDSRGPSVSTVSPSYSLKAPSGNTFVHNPFHRVHDEEPRAILIPLKVPDVGCVSGTYAGTLDPEWSAIDDFYGNLYPLLVRHANQQKLALDPTDIAATVEITMVNDFVAAGMKLQALRTIKRLADDSKDPMFMDWTQNIHRRRAYLERAWSRLEAFPFPALYRQWVDYLVQPVTNGPGSPFLIGMIGFTRDQRGLEGTDDVEEMIASAEASMDNIESSADKLKFLNALQTFRPAWAGQWMAPPPVVDRERVLMWQTRAVRNSNGATDRQSPNIEDSGWGNGERITLFSHGSPHPFQFTGIVPAITYEKDDKGSGDAAFGSTVITGSTSDDSDAPSELTYVHGRTNATVAHEPLDFAQSVADIGTKLWSQWMFVPRTYTDDPSDYFADNLFSDIKTVEVDLEDIGIETRKMITAAWDLPL